MFEHVIVHRDPHMYSSHPCITGLANGDWLVAFCSTVRRDGPPLHPPDDPRYLNLLVRSCDQGQTWEPARVAPNYDWYGMETPGIAQVSNGTVLLNQWRFLWYPLETAKMLWTQGLQQCFIFDTANHNWRPAQSQTDWEQHPFPYARADDGAYIHFSMDDGHTWSRTVRVNIEPYLAAFSPSGVAELSNGDMVLALGCHDHDPTAAAFLIRSSDQGTSWQAPITAAQQTGRRFSEPSVLATRRAKLLLWLREEVTGYIHQCESFDGGVTWSEPKPLGMWGYPIHSALMRDGRIVIVYGYRKPPYGIRAAVSADEGRNWSDEIVLVDNLHGGNDGINLGYPSVIEYARGKLFAVYYMQDARGVVFIRGTYFTVPD